jgi:hypothetical protein
MSLKLAKCHPSEKNLINPRLPHSPSNVPRSVDLQLALHGLEQAHRLRRDDIETSRTRTPQRLRHVQDQRVHDQHRPWDIPLRRRGVRRGVRLRGPPQLPHRHLRHATAQRTSPRRVLQHERPAPLQTDHPHRPHQLHAGRSGHDQEPPGEKIPREPLPPAQQQLQPLLGRVHQDPLPQADPGMGESAGSREQLYTVPRQDPARRNVAA